ncbi:MAG: fucose isomerase, partial [Bryobacterales bacterium]|nr:fucose isomerase [Bryobacterales bacterium]
MNQKMTFGLVAGNRGFFPGHLARSGRDEMIATLEAAGYGVVCPTPGQTRHGAVESREEARFCAGLFREHRDALHGIIVTLPNFGDEKAIAETIRSAGLDVPVLIHAFPDTAGEMTIAGRRDSFCGKMSACNNLQQYRIPFSLTRLHTETPSSHEFALDLAWFAAVCRVANGLRRLRIGAIGARPAAFNTVRYSEKILEANGITIEPIDLSEIFGRIGKRGDSDPAVTAKLDQIRGYVSTEGIPAEALIKMAKLGAVIDEWMAANDLDISAVQCWTSMEEYFGVVPCTVMSMMSNNLLPSGCEVDVPGVVGMYALALASETPS